MNEASLNDTTSVIQVRDFGRGFSAFSCSFIFIILVLELINLYQKREQVFLKPHKATKVSILGLLAVTIAALFVSISGGLLWWYDWRGFETQCTYFSQWAITIGYVMMKQFLYLFLFQRMYIVHSAIQFDHIIVKVLRIGCFFIIVVGIPVIFYPLILVFWRGFVLPEGVCVQYTINIVPIIMFAVCDAGLSIVLLVLFILPLTRHAIHRGTDESKKTALLKVATRNLIYSSVIITSTLFMLVFMSVTEFNVVRDGTEAEKAASFTYLHVLHTQFAEIDLFLSVVCSHLISVSWIPNDSKGRRIMSGCIRTQVSTQTTSTNNNAAMNNVVLPSGGTLNPAGPALASPSSSDKSGNKVEGA
jgi:hypothetical protein